MRPLLIFLSVLVTCVTSATLLGDKKCAWGPSYWCSHIKHAKECGAFQHCLDTVWKNTIIKSKSTDECTYCQLLVQELQDQLHKKATQEKIATVLAKVCDFLTNPDYKDQCKGIVTEDLPELIQMLDNDISANMICATLQFCSGLEDTYSPYGVSTYRNDRVGNSTCTDCMKFFKDVQDSVTSKETQDELEQLLNQTICCQLSSLADTCNELIKDYLPQALEFLADQIDPDIVCRVFGFCSTKTSSKMRLNVIPLKKNVFERKTQTALKYRGAEECEICKDLVGQVNEVIRDKTTQDKVKQFLEDDVCFNLGSFAAQCKQLIEEYAPLLFEVLVNELDPTTVCETVGICPTPTLFKISPKFHPEIIPAKIVEPANPGYVKNDIECTLCKTVVQEIDNLLRENQTVVTIEDFIDQFCAKLTTKELAKQCEDFVQEYAQDILDSLRKDLDPKLICTALKMCTGSVSLAAVVKQEVGLCDLCTFAVGEIETLLQNISVDAIMKDLDMVCTYLPSSFFDKCHTYVKDYAPLVIQLLKSKEDPKSLCTLATVCTSSKVKLQSYMTVPIPEDPVPSKPKVSAGPSVTCEVCNTVLVVIKSLVSQNSTEAEIKAALEKACGLVPLIKSECDSLVDEYGDEIVSLLLQHLDPHTICKKIGLCKQTVETNMFLSPVDTLPLQPIENKKVPSKPKVSAGPSVTCEVCDTVLVVVKRLISQKSTEAEIKAALDEVCGLVPFIKSECDSLVDEYGDEIIKYLLQHLDPHTICKKIGLCKQTVKTNMFLSPVDTLPLQPIENKKEVHTENPIECQVCTMVMSFIQEKIQENKTEENIKRALETVCSEIHVFTSECDSLVKEYTVEIINLFVLGTSPKEICQKLTLCSLSKNRTLPKSVHVQLLKDNLAATGVQCVVCEFVIKELDSLLSKNASKAEIEAALEKVCSLMPSTVAMECDNFVKEYGSFIISLLLQDLNPSQICTSLGLCTSKHFEGLKTLVHIIPDLKAGPTECLVCKYVVGYIKTVLKENVTEQEVEQLMDHICSYLPDTVTAQCDDVVKQYVPAIIKLLQEDIDSDKICQIIGLCNATMDSKGPERVVSHHDDNSLYFQPHKPQKPTKHMLGADKCTYGPSYWCASRENAKNCNAVEHCKVHVWNN